MTSPRDCGIIRTVERGGTIMFRLICGECGAEGQVVYNEKAEYSKLEIAGDVIFYNIGYEGELEIKCAKCGHKISDDN